MSKQSLQLQKINNICHHLDTIMDNEVLYSKVVDVIHKNLGYDHVALYLVDHKNNSIILSSLAGIYKGLIPANQKIKMNQGIVGYVVQTKKTILSNDVSSNSHFLNITPNKTPTKSELCVPICTKNKIIGVLNIESTEKMNFTNDDLNSLEVLANRIGVAIQNSRLYNKLEKNTQRLYHIVSSMGQGIILVNKDHEIEWINETCEKWFKKETMFLGMKCYQMFGKSDVCVKCPSRKIYKTGKIYRHIIVTDKQKYYSVTSAPVRDDEGNVMQILEVLDDITQNIDLRKKLENMKEHLEKLKYLAMLGELTSGIAHEIRNPLNAISTSISALQCNLNADDDDKKLLDIVKEETKRLDHIISAYLNYKNIPKMKFAYHDIRKSIEEVVLLLNVDKNVSEKIKIYTHFDSNIPKLKFDKDAMKQVFWNILINSIQSISNEGFIRICIEKDAEYVRISIQDTGKGIPKSHLKNIFKQFYTSKSKGSGLGLSIVKRILDQHQWVIHVASELNVGTIITIETSHIK